VAWAEAVSGAGGGFLGQIFGQNGLGGWLNNLFSGGGSGSFYGGVTTPDVGSMVDYLNQGMPTLSDLSDQLAAMAPSTGFGGGFLSNIFSGIGAFLGLEHGGVMTSRGPLPLRRYDGGGIADSAQLAMFGEGSTPEAYVPLPDGRSIPVALQGDTGGMAIGGDAHYHTYHVDARGSSDPAEVERRVNAVMTKHLPRIQANVARQAQAGMLREVNRGALAAKAMGRRRL